jgi:hypothetical protein
MYATTCYVGGNVAGLGTDAVVEELNASDIEFLDATLEHHFPAEVRKTKPSGKAFKKIVSGRKLWNFDKRDQKIWQEAL